MKSNDGECREGNNNNNNNRIYIASYGRNFRGASNKVQNWEFKHAF